MPISDIVISFRLLPPGAIARQIAQRVRDRRLARNWSRDELSRRTGIPTPTLRKFEDTGHIAFERLIQIAAVLDATREFETLFAPPPIVSLDQIVTPLRRKRGRTTNPESAESVSAAASSVGVPKARTKSPVGVAKVTKRRRPR
jgi:transcriptional regulator with XRE-family HTH domain